MNILVVVDMQNDFIDGSLGTEEAQRIVPEVVKKIQTFDGTVFATRDTHEENYLETAEGKKLPVRHCIRGTEGWQIRQEISDLLTEAPVDKVTFGSRELAKKLEQILSLIHIFTAGVRSLHMIKRFSRLVADILKHGSLTGSTIRKAKR